MEGSTLSPSQALDNQPAPAFRTVSELATWFSDWLRLKALPLWAEQGVDARTGGFREGLRLDGTPHDPYRRARVQARQAFVFARLSRGPEDPWLDVARRGLAFLTARGGRPNGLAPTRLDVEGAVVDAAVRLYDQDFLLLALAALAAADPSDSGAVEHAHAVRRALDGFRAPAGGFRETDDRPFQANAQMHLLEAALAWEDVAPDVGWRAICDELAELAMARFVDPQTGVLHEVFDADWARVEGAAGLVEPGHQFEWAWLLHRWGVRRGDARAQAMAERLYAAGRRCVDPMRDVAIDAVWADLSWRDSGARLWPQTEHLKAALALGQPEEVLQAGRGLARYLEAPVSGLWRDKLRPDGGFVDEPAPASSLYHLVMAVLELEASTRAP